MYELRRDPTKKAQPFTLEEFLLNFKMEPTLKEPQSPQTIERLLRAWGEAHNARWKAMHGG